jgi:hypothetical protein
MSDIRDRKRASMVDAEFCEDDQSRLAYVAAPIRASPSEIGGIDADIMKPTPTTLHGGAGLP